MSKVFKAVGNAVSNVVSGVVKAVGSVVKGVVNAVGSVVSGVLNFVMSPFLGLFGLGMPSMPDVSTPDSIKGVMVQHQGSDVYVPVVYGYKKVGGTVVYAETGSTTNKYLYVAYVLSEGQVEGLREVWFDNVQLPSSIIPGLNAGNPVVVTGKDNTGATTKFNNLISLQFAKGLQFNNPADTNVGNALKANLFKEAPSWTTSMNYNGLATLFARFEWPTDTTNNPFGGSIPQLHVCMLGKKICPLLTGNPEEHNWGTFDTGYTESYSMNPAEILLDYLRNPFYGKGLTNNEIDWDSFKRAAAKCNQQVEYVTGVTGPILTQHIVINTGDSIFNNCKKILSNFRAYLPYTQGKYKLIIEDAGNATDILSGVAPIAATFNKDNIQGEITYTGIDKSLKYNTVVVHYCDPDNQWSAQSVTWPEVESERYAYLQQDGYRENKGDFTFEGLTNPAIAKDMARLIFNKGRWQDTINLTVSSQGFELEPGDNIYIDGNILKFGTDPELQAVPWRIISCKLNNDYTFSLGCVRNPDFIYPHVRVGEIDYKYAVYVPKGATRYYPAEPIGIPIGLRPPGSAPTDPTDPGNPPQAPGVGVLTDKIDFYETNAVLRSTGIFVICKFLQPPTSAYAGVTIRYKQNLSSITSWTTIECNTISGANQPVTVEIGPVLNNTVYRIESVVKYQGGNTSTATGVTGIQIGVPQDGSGGGGGGTPVPPPTNLANTAVSYYFGQTQLVSSLPQNPRKVSFKFRPDTNINSLVNGYELWYKPSANPKWFKATGFVDPTATETNVTLALGNRIYPLVPGSGGVPGSVDNYDFIFRYTYSDGKTSIYQFRAMNCSVEYGAYGYDVQIFALDQGATLTAKELTSAYIPQLAGPGDIAETRSLTVSVSAISNAISNSQNRIYFALGAPAEADWVNWSGMRLYYHKAGTTATWSQTDSVPVEKDVYSFFVKQDIQYDANYEYVLVPLVNYGGTTVEAFQGRYMMGKIHNRTTDADYPSNGNWLSQFAVGPLEDVAVAKAHLGQVLISPPRADTTIAFLTSTTLTNAGIPFSPRRVQISFTQRNTGTPNGRVKGLKIYYKLNANIYFKEADYYFATPYVEGSTITINSNQTAPALDLGYPVYPNIPGIEQNYDFRFRWIYDDNTESKYETAFNNCAIERSGGATNFIFLGATIGSGGADYLVGNAPSRLNVDISQLLEKNQPPNTVSDSRFITDTITPYQLFATTIPNASPEIYVWLSKPAIQMRGYLAGFKIQKRQIIPGTSLTSNPIITDISNKPYISNDAVYVNGAYQNAVGCVIKQAVFDVEFEYLIIPQVWYNGAIIDANKCIYFKAKVHNRETELTGNNPYPYVSGNLGNWFSRYTPVITDYETALKSLSAPYPDTNPTIRVQSISRQDQIASYLGYHQLKFQVPDSFFSMEVYRRSVFDIKEYPNAYFGKIRLDGAGQWEKITPTVSQYSKDANNVITLNLRPAISGRCEYNWYDFNPANAQSASNTLYRNYTYPAVSPTPKKIVGDGATGSPSEMNQFLIVLRYTSGGTTVLSDQAVLIDCRNAAIPNILTDVQIVPFTSATSSTSSLINPVPVPAPHSSNLNTIKRTISEARTSVLASAIKVGPTNATYTIPTTNPPIL